MPFFFFKFWIVGQPLYTVKKINDLTIIPHISLFTIIVVVLLFFIHTAAAYHDFDGIPYTDHLEQVEHGSVRGGVIVDGENIIQFRASGDYAIPSGPFLVVEKDPNAKGSVADVTGVMVNDQDTATSGAGGKEDTPGFGVLSAVAAVLISTVVVFRKSIRLNKRND